MLEKINKVIVNLPSIIINPDQMKEIERILKKKDFRLSSITLKEKKVNGLDQLKKYKVNFITDLVFEFENKIEQEIKIIIKSDYAVISFPEDLESKTINLLQDVYYILIKKKSRLNPRILRKFTFIFFFSIFIIFNLLNNYLKLVDLNTFINIIICIEIFWGFNFFLGQLANYSKIQLHTNRFTKLLHYRLLYLLFMLSNLSIIIYSLFKNKIISFL